MVINVYGKLTARLIKTIVVKKMLERSFQGIN